jgi:hypothetical protein
MVVSKAEVWRQHGYIKSVTFTIFKKLNKKKNARDLIHKPVARMNYHYYFYSKRYLDRSNFNDMKYRSHRHMCKPCDFH